MQRGQTRGMDPTSDGERRASAGVGVRHTGAGGGVSGFDQDPRVPACILALGNDAMLALLRPYDDVVGVQDIGNDHLDEGLSVLVDLFGQRRDDSRTGETGIGITHDHNSLHFTVYSLQLTVYNLQFTLGLQFTLQFTVNN